MNLLKQVQDRIDDILEYFGHYYFHMIILMHVVYICVFVGIISFNSLFLKTFNIAIQTFVCVFLLFRFHPFRHHKLGTNDSKIIFGAAGFLLFNMIFVEFFSVYKFSKRQTKTTETDKPVVDGDKNAVVQGLVPLQFQ